MIPGPEDRAAACPLAPRVRAAAASVAIALDLVVSQAAEDTVDKPVEIR